MPYNVNAEINELMQPEDNPFSNLDDHDIEAVLDPQMSERRLPA